MNNKLPLAALLLSLLVSPLSWASPLIASEACPPNSLTSYDQYTKFVLDDYQDEMRAAKQEGFDMRPVSAATPPLFSKGEFEERIRYEGFECRRLTYLSDGLRVIAYHWKPKNVAGVRLPLIVFARGGSREFGKVGPWSQWGFYNFLKAGFTVIAPQYRGNDGGEGQEEFGGADVNDILNVVPLAASLPYIDTNNVFLFGRSRGGMMTCLVLKNGMKVRAAAIDAPLTNLLLEAERRPMLVQKNWSVLIPDFATQSERLMRERSAVFWADRISAPLLILQGGDDWRASPTETLRLASELAKHRKPFAMHYYAYDDHQLSHNRQEADQRVIDWFKAHAAN